jgi:hypothetical protein
MVQIEMPCACGYFLIPVPSRHEAMPMSFLIMNAANITNLAYYYSHGSGEIANPKAQMDDGSSVTEYKIEEESRTYAL